MQTLFHSDEEKTRMGNSKERKVKVQLGQLSPTFVVLLLCGKWAPLETTFFIGQKGYQSRIFSF